MDLEWPLILYYIAYKCMYMNNQTELESLSPNKARLLAVWEVVARTLMRI